MSRGESPIAEPNGPEVLAFPERIELLALARALRAALPEGPSEARRLVCEIEKRLEAGGQRAQVEAG